MKVMDSLWHRLWRWIHGCILITQVIKLCRLNMDNFCVSHTSIKCFKRAKNAMRLLLE